MFKKGDVVFISNRYFDQWSLLKSGSIAEVVHCIDFDLLVILKGDDVNNHTIDSRAIQKYNKENWCRVFLQMMKDSEDF